MDSPERRPYRNWVPWLIRAEPVRGAVPVRAFLGLRCSLRSAREGRRPVDATVNPAVRHQHLLDEEAGVIRGEEQRGGREFGGQTQPSGRR